MTNGIDATTQPGGLARRNLGKLALGTALAAAATGGLTRAARAQAPTIKIGVLHSLSGTMAISETTLKDVMLMLVDLQNKKGGVMGHQIEAVVVDPASNWPLFAEKARELINGGQGERGVRLLDQRVAQVGAAGVRGNRQPAVLPRAIRGRGKQQERDLHRGGAQPAGDPGGGLPDEREQDHPLGAGRDRLRVSAHHQQDPGGLPQDQGRRAGRHHDQLHAVRPVGLADDRGGHQEVRLLGQEDRGGLHHQRRRQRAVLQGAVEPGHQGDRHSRGGVQRRRGGTGRPWTPSRWWATWPPGTTS